MLRLVRRKVNPQKQVSVFMEKAGYAGDVYSSSGAGPGIVPPNDVNK